MKWTVTILNETVAAELAVLPADMRARFGRIVALIEAHGLERVREPHVKFLEGRLWEMRLSGRGGPIPIKDVKRLMTEALGRIGASTRPTAIDEPQAARATGASPTRAPAIRLGKALGRRPPLGAKGERAPAHRARAKPEPRKLSRRKANEPRTGRGLAAVIQHALLSVVLAMRLDYPSDSGE